MNIDDERDLLEEWFGQLLSSRYEYTEPFFGESLNSFVKKTCDALKQDGHVFIMALEILERYIKVKNSTNSKVENEIWTVCVCILIASKCSGDAVELKGKHIEAYVKKVAGLKGNARPSIKKMELEILTTLSCKVPVTTKIDDLITVVEKFVRDFNLTISLLPLCVEILELLCTIWKDFFFDIKIMYGENEEALKVFKLLITNKIFLPVGILIAALNLTNCKFVLNIDNIVKEYSITSRIHSDHLNTLASKIVLVVQALQPWFLKTYKNMSAD